MLSVGRHSAIDEIRLATTEMRMIRGAMGVCLRLGKQQGNETNLKEVDVESILSP